MTRIFLIAIVTISLSTYHLSYSQKSSEGWHIYFGVFKDYYLGDLNVSVYPDGRRRQYGSNDKFLDFLSWEIGMRRNVLNNKILSLEAGVSLAMKRKILTNRIKETGLPFDDQLLYGIGAYYLSFPLSMQKNSNSNFKLFFDVEPGLSILRFQRSEEMREINIPARFKDIWKYNISMGPGVVIKISDKIKMHLKSRYYLRRMYNDYSFRKFNTVGWSTGISYQVKP